jgi:hypothetical protein
LGLDHVRARQGFVGLHQFMESVRAGYTPPDGLAVTVLRHLIRTPEILAWHRFMWESYLAFTASLYGTVKTLSPDAPFLLHVDHQESTLDLLHRALMDLSEVADVCDVIKPILYHEIAGPRLRGSLDERMRTVLGEGLNDAQVLDLFYALTGYDGATEPGLGELEKGLSPDYVYRETKRFLAGAKGKAGVYPGIGVDTAGIASQPDSVYRAIHKAFEAGAQGIVLSREHDEMRVPTLEAAGRAVRERDNT